MDQGHLPLASHETGTAPLDGRRHQCGAQSRDVSTTILILVRT